MPRSSAQSLVISPRPCAVALRSRRKIDIPGMKVNSHLLVPRPGLDVAPVAAQAGFGGASIPVRAESQGLTAPGATRGAAVTDQAGASQLEL
jgi:hypothetical protein